jgi:alpha-tubulin suppressor-like RCC1 family protein
LKDQVLIPTLVQTFPECTSGNSNASAETADDAQPDTGANTDDDDDAADVDQHKVVDVSCGAGFTVAILKSGRVASWGVYIGGRLGLGPPPRMTAYSRREDNKKKVARYQLRPKFVEGIFNATSISCGEAHTLCVAGENELFSWGQNSCGQLGVGCDPSGFLLMYTYPVVVRPFCQAEKAVGMSRVRAVSVTCGSYHSLVIDGDGFVWSWGARGGSCLGQNDAPLQGPWRDRIEAVFTKSAKVSRVMVNLSHLSLMMYYFDRI